jgi:hypothetical protein
VFFGAVLPFHSYSQFLAYYGPENEWHTNIESKQFYAVCAYAPIGHKFIRGGAMNLHQRGSDLINQLKDHILEVLRSHPDAEAEGHGVLQEEVARRAGLHIMGSVELDHTCGEMLKFLNREGLVEQLEGVGHNEKKKGWRLRKR